MVHNGLHTRFIAHEPSEARIQVGKQFGMNLKDGYILHVGGNQWYKNRQGVIEIYDAWRSTASQPLPLLLVGVPPSREILKTYDSSPYKKDIHFITKVGDGVVNLAYSAATAFLFPSKAEGFGWPIAEAMAAGCPVITTNEAPMTEVGGTAGFYIPRRPTDHTRQAWATSAAVVLDRIVKFTPAERKAAVEESIANAKRFDTDKALDKIEAIYHDIVANYARAAAEV